MQVPINDIITKNRIRQDLGNLDGLAESLKRFGQISPIVITPKNVLIAGGRRLEAAKRLGWRTINAVVIEEKDAVYMMEYEMEENLQRQSFTHEEILAANKRLTKLKNPNFFQRMWNALARFWKKLFRRT